MINAAFSRGGHAGRSAPVFYENTLRNCVHVPGRCYGSGMEAQAWTAIGILAATLLGVLFYLGNRIDALGSEMRSQFQAQGARFDSRIDSMSARIDALNERVEEQGRQLGNRIYELAVKLDDHLRWHAG